MPLVSTPRRSAPSVATPYKVLVQNVEAHWDKLAGAGLSGMPNIMSGWDTRPRLNCPHALGQTPEP